MLISPRWLRLLSDLGGGSIVVDLLLNVLLVVCWSSLFVFVLLNNTLCPLLFYYYPEEEEKYGCFCYYCLTDVMCYYKCSAAISHGTLGWSVVCDCDIS